MGLQWAQPDDEIGHEELFLSTAVSVVPLFVKSQCLCRSPLLGESYLLQSQGILLTADSFFNAL